MIHRYLLIVTILICSTIFVNIFGYSKHNETVSGMEAISGIPKNFGNWHGTDQPLEENVYELLETRAIIHRNYISDDGKAVFLSLVYHSETKVNFHSPEQCLGSSGLALEKTYYTMSIKEQEKNLDIAVNKLIYNIENQNYLVFYFYKAGEFLGQDYIKLRWNLAFNKFFNTSKSGSLIRVSTPIINGDVEATSQTLIQFIADLYPYLIRYL